MSPRKQIQLLFKLTILSFGKKIRCLELIRYLLPPNRVSLKADSQVACRAHAVPLSINNVCLPFDLHSAAVSDSHLPCHAHAML